MVRPPLRRRMKLIAMVTEPKSVARYLARIGELTDVPGDRAPCSASSAAETR